MKLIDKVFDAVLVIEPQVFEDNRGYFFESFSAQKFEAIGLKERFVQDNESMSKTKGVLRGLHFQAPPFAQGKLIRVIKGSVLDVAVDIRTGSPTYGEHFTLELSEQNKTMLYIPPGFAHGFVTLGDYTIFNYKCTNYYNKASEGGIIWNDPHLGIDWKIKDPVLSAKDRENESFSRFNSPF